MKNITRPYLIWILNLFPIVVFFLFINKYAVNVPYMDDMELVDTVNELRKNFAQLPSILVRQQNDHRAMFSRLGILLAYWIKGTLDFRLTILLGYLNLILLGWAFFLIYRTNNKRNLWFLPITVLLFSPIVYQDHLWSITAYQHTLSIAFSLLALYFLQANKTKYWYYAFPLSIAATLTNLDGISLLSVMLFWLLTQKRWKHFFTYFLFSFLYLIAYFSDFKFSPASELPSSLDGFHLMAKSLVVLTGSITKVLSDTYEVGLSLILGSTILITYLLLKIVPSVGVFRFVKPGKDLLNFTLTDICFLKLLISMAMISVGRSADGIEGMMAIRFQIYSVSMLIAFYLFVIEKTERKALIIARYLFLPLAIVFNITSYIKYDTVVNYFSSGLKADTYNYTTKGVFLHQYFNLPDPEPEFYRNYVFPVFFDDEIIEKWQKGNDSNNQSIDLKVTDMENKGGYGHYLNSLIEFTIETGPFDAHSKEVFLCIFQMDGVQKPYIVALMKNNRSLYQRLKGNDPPSYLHGNIPDKLPTGTYQANLCWIRNGVPGSIMLSDSLLL